MKFDIFFFHLKVLKVSIFQAIVYNNLFYYIGAIGIITGCIFFSCNRAADQLYSINLTPYSNTYAPQGNSFTGFDTIFMIPELEELETYMFVGFHMLSMEEKPNTSKNPIIKVKVRAGDVAVDETDKFKVGIIDYNNNGIFDEVGIDRFFIAPFQSQKTHIEEGVNPWISPLSTTNLFAVNNDYYELYSIDENGDNVKIRQTNHNSDTVAVNAIANVEALFYLKDMENQEISSLELFDNKPLLLEFWFSRCGGCIKSFKYVQSAKLEGIDIVGVNATDDIETIKLFNTKHGFKFRHFLITKDLMKTIGNNGRYPSAVKYDGQGLLVDQFYKFPFK